MWRKDNKVESQKLLETRAFLFRTRERLLSFYCGAVERNECGRMNYLNRKIQEAARLLDSLEQIETELATVPPAKRFVVSSLFLYQCFRELTSDNKEQFFFIT